MNVCVEGNRECDWTNERFIGQSTFSIRILLKNRAAIKTPQSLISFDFINVTIRLGWLFLVIRYVRMVLNERTNTKLCDALFFYFIFIRFATPFDRFERFHPFNFLGRT